MEPSASFFPGPLLMASRCVAHPDAAPLRDVLRDGERWKPLRAAALLLLDHWGLHGPDEPGERLRAHLEDQAAELADQTRRHARTMGIALADPPS